MTKNRSAQAKAALKSPDMQTKDYIAELKKQNAKLNRQIAKLQVKNLDCENRVKALEKEIKTSPPKFQVNLQQFGEAKDLLTKFRGEADKSGDS